MTQEEIIEYNKRCAEFLGYSNPITDKDFYFVDKKDYEKSSSIPKLLELNFEKRFHSDWNWIMEVVEAIEKIGDWTLECLNYSDGSRDYQMMIPLSNTNTIFKDKKECIVQTINQFLIWYKEQQLQYLTNQAQELNLGYE